jgi:hypothetical protein
MTDRDPRSGWKRLEETLLAIKPGETITVEALAAECGLGLEMVEQLLATAITSELFERSEDGRVARRGIVETTTFSDSDRRAIIVDGRDAGANGAAGKPPLKR